MFGRKVCYHSFFGIFSEVKITIFDQQIVSSIELFSFFSVFKNYPNPAYGNCFAFNKENATDDAGAGKRVTSLTGPRFGLSLVLNIDPEGYMAGGRTQQVNFWQLLNKKSIRSFFSDRREFNN